MDSIKTRNSIEFCLLSIQSLFIQFSYSRTIGDGHDYNQTINISTITRFVALDNGHPWQRAHPCLTIDYTYNSVNEECRYKFCTSHSKRTRIYIYDNMCTCILTKATINLCTLPSTFIYILYIYISEIFNWQSLTRYSCTHTHESDVQISFTPKYISEKYSCTKPQAAARGFGKTVQNNVVCTHISRYIYDRKGACLQSLHPKQIITKYWSNRPRLIIQ